MASFPDVPDNHWAAGAVERGKTRGYLGGYPDGNYHGDDTVNRYQQAAYLDKLWDALWNTVLVEVGARLAGIKVRHPFRSGKSDDPDATLIRPSNWNEDHAVEVG